MARPLNLRIVAAQERRDDAPRLAALQRSEWGHLYATESLDDAIEDLLAWRDDPLRPDELLLSWFAVVDDTAVGVVMLRGTGELERDDAIRLPGPWLAGLVVEPAHRGRGIASTLVEHAIAEARTRGIGRLRLVTEHEAEFYERRGWAVECTVTLAGHPNSVLMTTLRP